MNPDRNQIVLTDDFLKLKENLRKEKEIRSLIRGLSLAEKHHFSVLVCESPVQAKAVLEVLEEDVSRTRKEQVKVIRLAFGRKDKEQATFNDLIAQILEPLYYPGEKGEYPRIYVPKIYVIDASDAQHRELEPWLIFFQRMNEVRNTLMDNLPGRLLLVLPRFMEAEFAQRAPDFWSVRSLFVRAEAELTEPEPLKKYLRRIKEKYGFLQVWRMNSPVELEGIYTRVNLFGTPSALRQTGMKDLEKMFRRDLSFGYTEETLDGFEALQKIPKLFILGKPGAGKTTFMKYALLRAVQGDLPCVPIFVPLRSFADSGKNLLHFIREQFEIFDFPKAVPFIKTILKEGRAMILLDGLDEVSKENQERVKKNVMKFCETWGYEQDKDGNKKPKNRFVITCRIAAAQYRMKDFTYVEIADFGKEQITAFVYKWFTREGRIADSFLKEFEESRNRRLQELAKNPLLLTLLCIGFQETLNFPARRSEIYEEALDALLRKWDTSRQIRRDDIYRGLSLGRKRQIFEKIAYETFAEQKYLFEQDYLAQKVRDCLKLLPSAHSKEEIDGLAVIKAIEAQHGIFAERAQGIYSFAHLTFQEYYTAKYLTAHPGELKKAIEEYFNDKSWQEVFLLTAELLDNADVFFEMSLNEINRIAAQNRRISSFLQWTETEAEKMEIEKKSLDKRIMMISVFLEIARAHVRALDRAFDRALVHADLAFGIAFGIAIAIDLALAFGIALNLAHIRATDRAIARSCASDLSCTLDRALALNLASNRSIDLAHAIAFDPAHARELLLNLSQEMGMTGLHQSVSALSAPSPEADRQEWKKFADKLIKVTETYFPVKEYNFTKKEADLLVDYLKAAKFILDCLEPACVSDRQGIEDRLLRAPLI